MRMRVTLYWLATAAAFAGGVALLILYTPRERTMGVIQKVFYVHLPSAICMLLCGLLVFVASIGYLGSRRMWWDDLAAAAARVAILLGAIVLMTGMLWGHIAWWGRMRWWYFTPKLTFSLLLFLLYLVYVMIRPAVESPQRRAVVAAVYGVIAFLDVPLVWLSARLIPDPLHPVNEGMAAPMKMTLLYWFVPVGLMVAGLIVARFRLNRAVRERADALAGSAGGDA
ncbi:MAG: hypothetical protein BIFFINMI_03154 [Phycisphaerae bacterium]|nr:hypothetical protein [Phycisphaerae bacterium]